METTNIDYTLYTDRARKIYQKANKNAQTHNHPHITTTDILLALRQEENGIASTALNNLNIKTHHIQQHIQPPTDTPKQTQQIAITSSEITQKYHHNYIGTEHILLALITHNNDATTILNKLHITKKQIKQEINKLLDHQDKHKPQTNQQHKAETKYIKKILKQYLKKWSGKKCKQNNTNCLNFQNKNTL